MKKPETIALHQLYKDLKTGFVYGRQIENVRYPYFDINLSYSELYNLIRYQNFGSSAMKCNISNLKWLLENIFNTSAIGFTTQYERRFHPIYE